MALLALKDGNPLVHIGAAHVNHALILANCLIFIVAVLGAPLGGFALYPSALFGDDNPGMPLAGQLIGHQFLHGGLLHLFGNMLVLYVFGDNVEDSLGHLNFALFFLACGVAGGVLHTVMVEDRAIPLIGASGAIAGVMGGYLLLHPRARILVLILGRIPAVLPAALVVGAAVGTDILNVLMDGSRAVGWWAHLGGFACGVVLTPLLKRRDVDLFQPAPLSRDPKRGLLAGFGLKSFGFALLVIALLELLT